MHFLKCIPFFGDAHENFTRALFNYITVSISVEQKMIMRIGFLLKVKTNFLPVQETNADHHVIQRKQIHAWLRDSSDENIMRLCKQRLDFSKWTWAGWLVPCQDKTLAVLHSPPAGNWQHWKWASFSRARAPPSCVIAAVPSPDITCCLHLSSRISI